MRPKIILTDADGTIVMWLASFYKFMGEKGLTIRPGFEHEYKMSQKFGIESADMENYIREFNESERIAGLDPLADSVEYIGKLAALGFRFICVTSQSDAPNAKIHRTTSLTKHFGDVFDEINCIKMGANKKEFLTRWKDTGYFWIEDHIGQAQAGADNGLKAVLITQPYNAHLDDERITTVSNSQPWKEIYDLVLKDYKLS